MKKIVVAILATLSGLVLLFSYRTSLDDSSAAVASSTGSSTTSSGSSGSTSSGGTSSGSSSGSSSSGSSSSGSSSGSGTSSSTDSSSSTSGGLVDGTYTGDSVQTRYGAVQAQIVVSGGTITAVDVPQYPNNNGRDQQINARAIPQLVSETLSTQSAQIDMVSGATYTSEGYLQSLQSAIDQATS